MYRSNTVNVSWQRNTISITCPSMSPYLPVVQISCIQSVACIDLNLSPRDIVAPFLALCIYRGECTQGLACVVVSVVVRRAPLTTHRYAKVIIKSAKYNNDGQDFVRVQRTANTRGALSRDGLNAVDRVGGEHALTTAADCNYFFPMTLAPILLTASRMNRPRVPSPHQLVFVCDVNTTRRQSATGPYRDARDPLTRARANSISNSKTPTGIDRRAKGSVLLKIQDRAVEIFRYAGRAGSLDPMNYIRRNRLLKNSPNKSTFYSTNAMVLQIILLFGSKDLLFSLTKKMG